MESTAKYNYEAAADGELSFRRGQCLKVLQTNGNWYKAELNEFEGYVPKNFIDMELPSWYQEDISRSEAEKKLMSQYAGAFLIRASQQQGRGNFSISVRHERDVQHFMVKRDSRWQYYLWSKKFPSLNQLVEYYRKNSINKQEPLFLRDILEPRQQQRRGSNVVLPSPKPAPRPDLSPAPNPDPSPVKSPVLSRARKPAPRPDPSPVQSPVLSPALKLAPRPDLSPVPRPDPSPDSSPVPRPDPSPVRKPVRKNAPKSDPSPDPRPEPRPSPRPAPRSTRSPAPRPDPSPVRGPAPSPAPSPDPSPDPAPRPVPAPRQHKAFMPQVKAMYDFQAVEKDELDFTAGDVIKVLECSHDNWWKGQLRGKTGLFPSNYTKPI